MTELVARVQRTSNNDSGAGGNGRTEAIRRASGYDGYLLLSVLALMGVGIITVYSASSMVAMERHGSDTYFLGRQVIWVLLSIGVIACCRHVSYSIYRDLAYPILGLACVLLLLLYLPGVSHPINGSRRWLQFFGMSFQPSEWARLALIVYLAYSMSKKGEDMRRFNIGLLPHALILAFVVAMIVFQPDFGTSAVIAAIVWIMLFLGGSRLRHLVGSAAALAPIAYFIMMRADYRVSRIKALFDPWKDEADSGYQIIHSLMAFASGGWTGAGVGKGCQKMFYLPEAHTDFVLSVVGEEFGLLGVCVVLALFVVVVWRGVMIAMKGKDLFGTFLAAGLTVSLGLQVCLNAGVVMQLLPTKGLPLPFVSYGGTALLANAFAIGILMNISAQREATPK